MRPSLPLLLALVACAPVAEDPVILDVAQTSTTTFDALTCEVHVVRTPGDVPRIYAHDRLDAARALGFVYARDRYFTLDAARRLSLGTLSGLLGDLVLDADVASRIEGTALVARQLADTLEPSQKDWLAAYAEGVNRYVQGVADGDLPPPSELDLAGPLLGEDDPAKLMSTFTGDDVAAVLATLVFQLGWEPNDAARSAARDAIADIPYDEDDALYLERIASLSQDLVGRIDPLSPIPSAPGWTPTVRDPVAGEPARGASVPPGLVERAIAAGEAQATRRGMPVDAPRGSNAWAVAGSATKDGATLLAGDGHLPLTVPSLFWQMGVDTQLLGGTGQNTVGLGLPGLPDIAVGTNGKVAWSQTRLRGDITDMYAEVLRLDDEGRPDASWYRGQWEPLVVETETFQIAGVLGGDARTVEARLYTTFDGRRLVQVEGDPVDDGGTWTTSGQVTPGDTDGDATVSGISVDFAGYDPTGLVSAVEGFQTAQTVGDFRRATRFLNAYGQNMVAADVEGGILYSSYQGQPCRTYLDRSSQGGWLDGSDPTALLDGTTYPGFTVPTDSAGRVSEAFLSDPTRCVVPVEELPYSVSPEQGYVLTANEDPGGSSFDGDMSNDRWYTGGPWDPGFRTRRIDERLAALVDANDADLASMQALQADHQDAFARWLAPYLVAALDRAEAASPSDDGVDGALATLWDGDARLEEARDRLVAWAEGGWIAESGVKTSYAPEPTEQQVADSVATMIFNAWLGRYEEGVLGDEPIPDGIWEPSRSGGTMRLLVRMLQDRDGDAPYELAGRVEATGESALFDVLGTEAIETSDEVILAALVDALDWLEGPGSAGSGGFDTTDMDAWRWGLRHQVVFDSILAGFLGDDPLLGSLTRDFAITTDVLDPGEGLGGLDHFPRPGSNASVDAASFGSSTEDFTYATGPSFRMVVALGDEVTGVNILPGGQSAVTDSPFFADQAQKWLGNEALAMPWAAEGVVAIATGREVLVPGGEGCGTVE